MRKFTLSIIIALMLTGHSSAEVIHTGVLGFLGTTEAKFQAGLDIFKDKIPEGYHEDIYNHGFVRSLRNDTRVIHFFGSLMRMMMSLRSGNIDEVILPEEVGRYAMNLNSELEVKFMSEIFTSRISFAFKKEDTALKSEFDRAILAMKEDGTIDELAAKFIYSEGSRNPKPMRPETFEGAETITVAVTGDMPPIDMFAGDGKPAGYSTAILAEIGKRLGKNIRLVNTEAGARNSALISGRADVVFWYRTVKIELDAASGVDNSVFIDAPDGIILSEPYYSWKREIVLKMSDTTGPWGLFRRK
ncbi:MAG: transporter substrate-binding domain-containing protein [Synergistaceae bacterium]|nr:transporter substrate-binding domain-containing protein [Synergistaceae bacterium]MBQ3346605.1 transporter substrate-binding domain-containing protein [Synergistaceae bacterium]MBQ3399613.1 transporter substrate-binding domain-containing protein [Synergistaceae bacterium]MBQ3758574.1 transporter substrate-binding domain-containing protein [Synergistaceae bacterium]MBQ6418937.1 transporter substrate-binding domain-containing protein [Synergistaceae bacterium]